MGLWISRIFDLMTKGQEAKLLMLGLDAAGKTTILYYLRLGENINTFPTVGFNVEVIKSGNIQMTIWDVGGQEKIRPIWQYYFNKTNGLIYIIDSYDIERLYIVLNELKNILLYEEMCGIPILIFANKQDLPNSLNSLEIEEKLNLKELLSSHTYHVFNCCGRTGEGIHEGILWLRTAIQDLRGRKVLIG